MRRLSVVIAGSAVDGAALRAELIAAGLLAPEGSPRRAPPSRALFTIDAAGLFAAAKRIARVNAPAIVRDEIMPAADPRLAELLHSIDRRRVSEDRELWERAAPAAHERRANAA
jgi:hypothetical protein